MKKLFFLVFGCFGLFLGYSQSKFTISGYVTDGKTGEKLSFVAVYFEGTTYGTTTNQYGFYSLTLPLGEYLMKTDYLGYETVSEKIKLKANLQKNFVLTPSVTELEGVVVQNNVMKSNVRTPEMGVVKLPVAVIKKMPVILGEVDVIKSLLLLPGVSSGGEGSAGFNVRGGSADQNLVLLDEATIFNASHLFGFFGVINADAIRDLTLYKGGIPARYGGRVSSVLDIYQKEGNSQQFAVNGGLGLLSSRLLLEGPIVKDKISFLVGGRTSYAHWFLKLFNNPNSAYFYDLNTKLSYQINDKNALYLSGYFGRDYFDLSGNFNNLYGNEFGNLRWNHLFSDKLFSNLSAIYSRYYYGLDLGLVGFSWKAYIQNFNLKYDFKHYLSERTKLGYGFGAIYHDFNPGEVTPIDEKSKIKADKLDKKYALETALYLEGETKITPEISVAYGLRHSRFYRLGAENIRLYQDNQPVGYSTKEKRYYSKKPIDSIAFGRHKVIDAFRHFEPRLTLTYAFDDNHSIKLGYNKMAQYLHLISNRNSPIPQDIWMPSGRYAKPQLLDQTALGYTSNFKDGNYSLEVETFYRTVQNRLDYIDGANLTANNFLEQEILSGEMQAYGLEVYLKKNTGKLTGWISYTLSNAEQRVKPRNATETGINFGNWYKTAYNKTHDLSVTALYNLNKKWDFGVTFVFQSGMPVTFPNARYDYQGIYVPNFGMRNTNNLPTYHRLDISATYTPSKNKDRKWKNEWVFGIYNVYNRMNTFSMSFSQNAETGKNEATRLSIFGIVPSVSYNFKF
ncbi:carboxypeptidase-like regulatory domain-containing protein [Capnocytophaga canimorsus]|uniref:TonB-dependent receptor n=1 Tax=Capnocytophaga canimorsus TaxID=28188 RepID=UPI0037D0A5AB